MTGSTVVGYAKTAIQKGTTTICDAYRSFNSLGEHGYTLDALKFDAKKNPEQLKWIHTTFQLLNPLSWIFHGLDNRHLQAYDEFCYRFNRRMFNGELFEQLIYVCPTTSTVTYSELAIEPKYKNMSWLNIELIFELKENL